MKQVIIALSIIVVITIVIIAYVYLRKKRTHNVIQDSVLELTGDVSKKYPSNLLPVSSSGNKYTLAFCIYSNNLAGNSEWKKKYDLPKGIISHYGSPNVYMLSKVNTLRISLAYRDDLSNKAYYNFDIKDFKHQRWEHVAVVVDNRKCHVFLNGEMIKSIYLPNVPWISQNSFYIGQSNNNFNGKIRDVEYFNDALTIKEIEKLYLSRK